MANYIGKTLSGGVMALCVILLFTPESHGVGGKAVTRVISGSVGEAGVTMQGFPASPAPVTDENGVYSVQVKYGWSGTVTPTKAGYTFEPKQRAYSNVVEDKTGDDYVATLQTFIIAGTTDKPGVKLRGLPDDPNSDNEGRYSVKVPFGWSGTVTPELRGFRFEPASKDYTSLSDNKMNDNYAARMQTFTIAGSVGTEGVVMKGFPTEVKTNKDGLYRVEVPFEWSGKVTPVKEGHDFTPELQEYSAVTDNYENQDYVAHVFTFEISGSAGMGGVLMAGLPGEPMTDLDGRYTATVEYGWSGKITPTKAGYGFKPSVIEITKVTENKPDQNCAASINKYKISGSTGIGGVKLTGLPEEISSGSTGSYTVTVDYGWTGTITPEKEGYTFDPQSLFVDPVEKDKAKQDFKSKAVTSTISGNVGLAGVELKGLPGRIISQQDGSYTVEVPFKWDGVVTPVKEGYTFDPAKKEYTDVVDSATAEDYTHMVKQYTIAGRITTDKGVPIPDVFIMTDKQNISAMTGPTGEFTLSVDHGLQLKLTPQKEGCNFTPLVKSVGPVNQNLTNQSFSGKVRMVTITDSIVVDDEPVQGVTVKDKEGIYTATTNAKGIYSIQVPYGWTGELFWTKPGFEFDPASELHQNITESIDRTGTQPVAKPPEPTTRPPTTGPEPTTKPAPITPATGPKTGGLTAADILRGQGGQKQPDVATTTTTTPKPSETTVPAALTEKEILQKMIEDYKLKTGLTVDANTALAALKAGSATQTGNVPSNTGPIVSGNFAGSVRDVLGLIMQQTGAKVYADATVKSEQIPLVSIPSMPMASALTTVLQTTSYKFRHVDKPEEGWQVFRPISNSFSGSDLRQVLQDIGAIAQVAIIPDETVSGQVWADLQGVPLEVALETVLAGTSYVVKSYPNYYLVADRKVEGSAFDKISETKRVRLNYISPNAAKSLLSQAFTQYVQAEMDPNSHVVTITAPSALAERIAKEIKDLDIRPLHVLLDARIVSMERGDLLNIGVEWGMPTAQIGFFGNSWERGTHATGEADPAGSWPWGVSVGLGFDQTFTNSLTAALNLLQSNSKADIIASPTIMARDGERSRIQNIVEEYYMMTAPINQSMFYTQSQLETIKSGTTLEITPLIGDNNDIRLDLAVEVSDSIPRGRGSDLPVVTRRTAQNSVVIRDGGTVAVAGLTENRTRDTDKRVPFFSELPLVGGLFRNSDTDKATREIAVFVTAHIVPEHAMNAGQISTVGQPGGIAPSAAGDSFSQDLRDAMSR